MTTEKIFIGYSDINKEFQLSNTSILKFFQNATSIHSKSVGDSLKNAKLGWFLTSYHVKIIKRPEYESWVKINTWSRDVKGFIASREFEIRDEENNLLVCALSNWARVNLQTQKLERISQETIEAYGKNKHSNFDILWLPKLKECDHVDFEKEYLIDRNFIDTNKHMNNVAYLEIANLVLPDSVYEKPECLEFEIMYKKSIYLGQRVKCLYTEMQDHYIISIKSPEEDELYAIIKLYK